MVMHPHIWSAGLLGSVLSLQPLAVSAADNNEALNEADQRSVRRQELLQEMERLKAELKAIDGEDGKTVTETGATAEPSVPPAADTSPADAPTLETVTVNTEAVDESPNGRTIGKVERNTLANTVGFTIKEALQEAPGIYARQGNGPRDMGISIRGSNAKNNFGVRNIKVYEDGFPVTQSDGLSRTDITDPHAYESIDIIRGPSSSRFDNYAQGGVLDFHVRKGHDIQGIDIGNDFGSFGYQNHYAHVGHQIGALDYSLFGSYASGSNYLGHSDFAISTENIHVTYGIAADKMFTFKLINNDTSTNVANRLTKAQFRANPYSSGGSEQWGQHRDDRRTIVGGRYDQQINNTTVSLTGVYDVKDIDQIFNQISSNVNPNFNTFLDVTNTDLLFGMPAKHYGGIFFNYMEQEGNTFNNSSFFNNNGTGTPHTDVLNGPNTPVPLALQTSPGSRANLAQNSQGSIRNFGGRLREELTFLPHWTGILGIGVEQSVINAKIRNYDNGILNLAKSTQINREMVNWAPEAMLVYSPNEYNKGRLRFGYGYGIPSISNLTTGQDGLAGLNTGVQPQVNYGWELGWDAHRLLHGLLDVSLTGYYEFWQNEIITVSPIPNRSSFAVNAKSAQHRGIEFQSVLHPFAGTPYWDGVYLRTAYTFNDHFYTNFTDYFNVPPGNGNPGRTVAFNRNGKQIPGVERNIFNVKLGFDNPTRFGGIGGWVELNYLGNYFINSSNTLKMPGFKVVNLNFHYNREFKNATYLKGMELYFNVQNVLDETYISSANVIPDAAVPFNLDTDPRAAAFFAGAPRTFVGGLRLKF